MTPDSARGPKYSLCALPKLPKLVEMIVLFSGSLGIADKPEVLSYQKTRFAPLVCYESIYGAYVAHFTAIGAQVLFIITNDGWWDDINA